MSHKLTVIQVLPTLNNGGVERGTVEVANFLAEKGCTSIVISSGGNMVKKLSPDVEHIALDIGKKSFLTLLKIKTLKKIFQQKQADIVHARSRLPAWLAYRAIKSIKNNQPKLITTIHGLYSVKRYSSIMARGDKVITVSETTNNYVKENYSQYLKSEPVMIYRGINPEEFPYDFQADFRWLHDFYQKHHQLVGKKLVLMPGRLTSLKGVKDLLDWLKQCDENCRLVLTATPDDDFYAAKLLHWFRDNGVEDKVYWLGLQDSMAEIYSIADVVVSASKRPEAFGRTVLESLSVGTPVVGYNHGGVGEILNKMFPEGKIKLGDTQQMANVIDSILSNQPEVKKNPQFLLTDMLNKIYQLYLETANVD